MISYIQTQNWQSKIDNVTVLQAINQNIDLDYEDKSKTKKQNERQT